MLAAAGWIVSILQWPMVEFEYTNSGWGLKRSQINTLNFRFERHFCEFANTILLNPLKSAHTLNHPISTFHSSPIIIPIGAHLDDGDKYSHGSCFPRNIIDRRVSRRISVVVDVRGRRRVNERQCVRIYAHLFFFSHYFQSGPIFSIRPFIHSTLKHLQLYRFNPKKMRKSIIMLAGIRWVFFKHI